MPTRHILRKVLSCRKNLFTSGLVLLVVMVFGFDGLVYSADSDTKYVTINEGADGEVVMLEEGDGIRWVKFDVKCKNGKEAHLFNDGKWNEWASVIEVSETVGEVTLKIKCLKKKSK